MDWKKIWIKIEKIEIDTGKDDIETVRQLLKKKDRGVISFKSYKELKEERE